MLSFNVYLTVEKTGETPENNENNNKKNFKVPF